MTYSGKSVLLLGATGLVGGECLKLLAVEPSFARVVVLTRRPMQTILAPHVECHQVNFDDTASFASYLNVSAVICALGTTIKKAGSQVAFRKVDYDYPLTFATLALEAGAKHFLLVSSIGASANSRVFYSRVKGELEVAISALRYPAVSIFRPSLLLGSRNEFRLGESVGQALFNALSMFIPKSVRGVQARQVAVAIVKALHTDTTGVRIVGNADML
jgi:uncharacterized protein YbjT (DUF2867 family)